MSQSHDPKYTLCSDSPTQNTHIHTHSLGHILLIETRVFLSSAARPLPAARTHIVSHCLPLSHPLWMAPGVLSFLSDFLALSLPPASLFESLLSMNLPISCLFTYRSYYLCPLSPFPLSQACSPRGRKEKERGSPNPGPAARHFPILISLQTSHAGCFRRRQIREENENTKELKDL